MPKPNILHDGSFDIATGRSRAELSWKNKEMRWSDLVNRVSATHYTAETHSEYLAAKKPRQDEIKDVGGFVGGYLTTGRRKAGNVLHRQLITLDIDFGTTDFWEDFITAYGNAAVIYSTHKHSPDKPRYRLILPLDRPVMAEEYEAIARKIAGILDIELFDVTTFQPIRLMYWPSTSKDGVYEFHYQDGPWLSADDVLASYRNWADSSEWPVSERVNKLLARNMLKQGDPLEKPGVVGAFCRTYTIAEAISTFLADVYDPCDVEDRYSYKEGSTAAGLVVYEDKYAYSHHGTDPTSGKLCNAFDLVRLHKYGLQDEDAREGTASHKLPSYLQMVEFATKVPQVRQQLGNERLADARHDFAEFLHEEDILGGWVDGKVEEPVPDNSWLAELAVDKKGNYYCTINNMLTVLNNDPGLKGRLALNTFEQREVSLKSLPWRKVTDGSRYLTDTDDAGLRHYLEKVYGLTGVQKIDDALDIVMLNNSFHPVIDYLNGLKWDGVKRVDTLLIDYLGAEDKPYTRHVTRKTLTAAVARVFKPGVKFEYVLTTIGVEGIGKSTLINKLGGAWFSDSFLGIDGTKSIEQLQGTWLMEIPELAVLKRAEVEAIKAYVGRQIDRYRVAYGKRTDSFPRQCIFFATTNNWDFLKSANGNRRFWPVVAWFKDPTKDVFKDLTENERGQVWAEVMQLYKAGETLYLDKLMEKEASEIQRRHTEVDERTGMIAKYLDTLLPTDWKEKDVYQRRSFLKGDELEGVGTVQRTKVCVPEIWCEILDGYQKDMTRYNTKDIHNIMRNMDGWTELPTQHSKAKFRLYGTQKTYVREKITDIVALPPIFQRKNEKN